MSVVMVLAPFWMLVSVQWVDFSDALSYHFYGVGRRPLQTPLIRQLYFASSTCVRPPTQFGKIYRRSQLLHSFMQPRGGEEDDFDVFFSLEFPERSEKNNRSRRVAKNTRNEFTPKVTENTEGHNYSSNNSKAGVQGRSRSRQEHRELAKDGPRNGRLETSDHSLDKNVYFDDFYDINDFYAEDKMAGNFWSNRISSRDNSFFEIPRRGRQQRRFIDDSDSDDVFRRNPRQQDRNRPVNRRIPGPSGLGHPPKVFKEFYDQLFWYGFDVDDSAEVGDNTIFGGTKGKFNGFNYLMVEQNEKKSSSSNVNSRRLLPSEDVAKRVFGRRLQRDVESDYYNNNDNEDDGIDDREYYTVDDSTSNTKPLLSSLNTPPTDQATTRYDLIDCYDEYKKDDDEYIENGRIDRQNSARYSDENKFMDRRSGGRRRRRKQTRSVTDWSLLSMLESFLGIDTEEMDYKADIYNAKMGLGQRRRSSSLSTSNEKEGLDRERSNKKRLPQRRRPTRDQYDVVLENDSTPVLDMHLTDDKGSESMISNLECKQQSLDNNVSNDTKAWKKERSWEERQIATEQVPPVGIIAWGPSGGLPMSAREKAFMDAQEDIETARRKLNLMKKKRSEAKEEMSILNVDAEQKRFKLSESPLDKRSCRHIEELRQAELDIDEASRELRRSRAVVDRALEKLDEVEERHHAIMSCYNIDQASLLVEDSLNQFSSSIQGTSANSSTLPSNVNNFNINDDS